MSAMLEFYFQFRVWPYCRHRHLIWHQPAKFLCKLGNSWRSVDVILIFQDGRTASQIYFQFPVWSWLTIKVKNYLHTKFHQDSSIQSRDITISGLQKQTAAIWKFYFRVSLWCFHHHWHVILCRHIPNFIQIGPSAAKLWRHGDFQDSGHQPCCICCSVMIDHPQSVVNGCCYVLKFRLDRVHSAFFRFSHFGSRPLLGGMWGIIPRNDVNHHPNPEKAPSCMETRHLSHKAWKSV